MMDYSKISIIEDANIYHSKSGNGINDGKYLGSHSLIDYQKNQLLYKRVYVDKAVEKEMTESLKKGTAIHRCVLEKGAKFVDDYTVGYPINEKTGKEYGAETKVVAEFLAGLPKDKPFISKQEMADILKINEIVSQHEIASDMVKNGLNERVIRTKYEGVNCQIRIDCFNQKYGIGDLKKTRSMAGFLRDADKFGYWFQAGYYSKIFEIATGKKPPFFWIVCEDVEPFECVVYELDREHLEYAQRLVESAILEFKEAILNNSFLTGREGINCATWWKAEKEEGVISI